MVKDVIGLTISSKKSYTVYPLFCQILVVYHKKILRGVCYGDAST